MSLIRWREDQPDLPAPSPPPARAFKSKSSTPCSPRIDKACGEGLMPDSLAALAAIGFRPQSRPPSEFETASPPRHPLPRRPTPTPPKPPSREAPAAASVAPSSTSSCSTAPPRLGVRFHWENSVQSITPATPTGTLVRTNRQTLHARYLIGADGPRSRVANWAGLAEASIHSRRIGLRQHYAIAPWTDFVEVYWSNHGQAYVTPISSNQVCVAFIANAKILSPTETLQHFPALARHLASAQTIDTPRGSITLGRNLRRVTTGNIALIGDASGSVDAITGEGLALCFRQAAALSLALKPTTSPPISTPTAASSASPPSCPAACS